MKMLKGLFFVTVVNCFALFLVTLLLLPDIIPLQFNYKMVADRYGSRWEVLASGFIPIIVSAGMLICFHLRKSDYSLARNQKAENILLTAVIIFLIIISRLPVLIAFKYEAAAPGLPIDLIEAV